MARAGALLVAALLILAGQKPATLVADGVSESPGRASITWGVRPSSPTGPDGRDAFTYVLEAGSVVEDHVGVSNFGEAPLELAVYASDAFTTEGGGFDLLPADQPPSDVGAWVTFEAPAVVVPPRSRLDIPFRLKVPDRATPGDHVGGIVASLPPAGSGSDPGSGQLRVDRRVGARIYMRVAGEVEPSVDVTDVEVSYRGSPSPAGQGRAEVAYTIVNDGNVRIRGVPTVEVDGPFHLGRVVAEGAAVEELLPGNRLRVRTTLAGVAPLGRLDLRVRFAGRVVGTDSDRQALPPVSASRTTWAIPWPQLGVLMVFGAGAVVRLRRRRRRQRALARQLELARAEGRAEAASVPSAP